MPDGNDGRKNNQESKNVYIPNTAETIQANHNYR
jgi:hypothetical protein